MTKTTSADWLRLAKDDLVVAKEAHKKEIYHLACFHAQQAAEKLLKACLIHANLPVPKTHSLIELYEKVEKIVTGVAVYQGALKILDKYYIPTRYPDALPGSLPEGLPTETHSQQALANVEELFDFIAERVRLRSG